MKAVLEVLVVGVQFGAIYSLVGLGVALVYKATGILNFAQGELGTVPAFVAFIVLAGGVDGQPSESAGLLLVASVAAVAVGAAMGVLTNVAVIRRLATSNAATSLVATAGLALLLTSTEVLVFEAKARPFPRYVDGGFGLPLADITVSYHTVVIVAVLAGAAALLAAFFRTPAGTALLATAQEPFAAELQGVSVTGMRTVAWGSAGALAAVAGLLGAGVFTSISPGLMTTAFLIPAFTGAVLGGISSLVGAVGGGLLLGITVAAANRIVRALELELPGPPQLAVMAVLLLVLLLRPRGLFGKAR